MKFDEKHGVLTSILPLSADVQEEEVYKTVGVQNIICFCLGHSGTCSLFNMS